jgi:hypothetical protein
MKAGIHRDEDQARRQHVRIRRTAAQRAESAEEMVSALLRGDARARGWPIRMREMQGESCRCRETPSSVGELDCPLRRGDHY